MKDPLKDVDVRQYFVKYRYKSLTGPDLERDFFVGVVPLKLNQMLTPWDIREKIYNDILKASKAEGLEDQMENVVIDAIYKL